MPLYEVEQETERVILVGVSQQDGDDAEDSKAVFTLHNAHLWDGVEDPFLYTVSAKLDNGEETDRKSVV